MKLKNRIILEFLNLAFIAYFFYSYLCYSTLYFFGGAYYPINESNIKNYIPFEFFVIVISALILLLLFLKLNAKTFSNLLFQNFVIAIFSFPLLFCVSDVINPDFNESDLSLIIIAAITIILVELNIHIKIKKVRASSQQRN